MPDPAVEPSVLTSASGLRVEVNANGSLRRFECGGISLGLFVGNELEGGPANLYLRLRRHRGDPAWIELLGPRSPTRFRADPSRGMLHGSGSWRGIEYSLALILAAGAPAWFWRVQLRNTGDAAQGVELTYAQDIALAPYGAVRMNEYYVSQYLDHTALRHPEHGYAVATRQNQAVDGRYPWCLIGSLRAGEYYATDALDFHGLEGRRGEAPRGLAADPPGRRLQHEHAMVVVRDAPLSLPPGAAVTAGFFGAYAADHPAATTESDLARVAAVLALPEAAFVPAGGPQTRAADPATLFTAAPALEALDLDEPALRGWFGAARRHEERDEQGRLLSFFHGDSSHVVLRRKELRVLRPHGHILRTGAQLGPDESALASTVWMAGVFHSMVTQGHVNINRFLSTVRGYLGLFRSHGLRVFVELEGGWRLLELPSAFDMSPDGCRWLYAHAGGAIEVESGARGEPHELSLTMRVRAGRPVRFLLSLHVALNGDDGSAPPAACWRAEAGGAVIEPAPGSELAGRFPTGAFWLMPAPGTEVERIGGDEALFLDGRSRRQPYLCVVTAPAASAAFALTGHLVPPPAGAARRPARVRAGGRVLPAFAMPGAPQAPPFEAAAQLADILPWFVHDALVHYLAPRGLEQFSGGGWGTRDVCQGPVELLLAADRAEAVRDLMLTVLRAQNPDGDWPQWFTFFERDRAIRAGDSHGDIVFWPLLVLARYLLATGDASVLEERVPFFDPRGPDAGEQVSVWRHVERALALIDGRVIPGTALAAYGHGDWNDSLQPVDPAMRGRLCSAWTVTLHFQTLTALARALGAIGRAAEADRLGRRAEAVRADFQRLLIADGVLAGYAAFDGPDRVSYLLHPRDGRTGVRYSALAMVHAIIEDLLSPAQTRAHLALIDRHLSGPDGLRLFDRPLPYHGGPAQLFQRAETATFFGREIGLMYTHAHLRYAQCLAHVGEAEGFLRALRQANPIAIRDLVRPATVRQSNVYFSSSDAAFADRRQASEQYGRVAEGTVALDGGWRVYSSGPGIACGLVMRSFVGLSREAGCLRVDPVMPRTLDGLSIGTTLLGRPLEVRYRIGALGHGVAGLELNGKAVSFDAQPNPHRRGAALVPCAAAEALMQDGLNRLVIDVG